MNLNKMQEDLLKTANRFRKMKYEFLFHDISKREFEMLMVMEHFSRENDDRKGIYVWELAKALHISSPAVSKMIRALEERGYAGRDVDKADRRNTYVYVTDKGKEAQRKSKEKMDEVMRKVVIRMGEKNMKEFIVLCNLLEDIMEEELKGDSHV
ncbi:DNA-binding MarR family transcriptional regulator [Kineothrix alysoides]|uniref:DNA-binding MarR family transcriptional regulator n=1 Tax=Kineothrix alysoides TaxID=1469948 RepID=A0A4R1QT45_9FIRM|nr:MarR family transcriptional regulator [Kineothrix alysoides]TCL55655.1 DNA-binding MarR family transcriptional regulator [Kineothrix alysoides]